MAMTCAHCGSADVMAGFDTYQCLSCGRITGDDGSKLLPDSLHTGPNHQLALEQFGWPFDDQAAAVARAAKVVATQWGTPFPAEEASA